MPIYEFYCADCHTVFSFLSRSVNTRKRPNCPRCKKRRLVRQASAFAVGSGRTETQDALGGADEDRIEQALSGLARDAEGIDENDPRAMARLMQRFYDESGARMGAGMEEALQRLESGEDPDQIEEQMGDLLDGEDPFSLASIRRAARDRRRPPRQDPELYEL